MAFYFSTKCPFRQKERKPDEFISLEHFYKGRFGVTRVRNELGTHGEKPERRCGAWFFDGGHLVSGNLWDESHFGSVSSLGYFPDFFIIFSIYSFLMNSIGMVGHFPSVQHRTCEEIKSKQFFSCCIPQHSTDHCARRASTPWV